MPSLYYSVPPQHIIIQTWEAGLTSSEIIAPLWYIYSFINNLFILFRANPAIITWEACQRHPTHVYNQVLRRIFLRHQKDT